jgi:hypothetical protein
MLHRFSAGKRVAYVVRRDSATPSVLLDCMALRPT